MKKLILILVLAFFATSVYSLEISSQKCESTGKISITLEAVDESKTYTNLITIFNGNKEINGTWNINYMKRNPPDRSRQFATFTSEEGVITEGGNRLIKINYRSELGGEVKQNEISTILECPKFHFSCVLLDVEVDQCYIDDEKFYAYFYLRGFEQSAFSKLSLENNLEFGLFTEKHYEDETARFTRNGGKPKDAIVRKFEGDKYVLSANLKDNLVERFRVGLIDINACLSEKYKFYDLRLNDVSECGVNYRNTVEENLKIDETIGEEKIIEEEIDETIGEEKIIEEEKTEEKIYSDVVIAGIILAIIIISIAIFLKIRKYES